MAIIVKSLCKKEKKSVFLDVSQTETQKLTASYTLEN